MLTVQRHKAAAVAEAYGLDARALRRWMRRNQNVTLLGTMDSPAMKQTVHRFLAVGRESDEVVRAAYKLAPDNVHIENEYRGRGLMAEGRR